jgi:hypothetical protein
MSLFDAQAFFNQTLSEANSTERIPAPAETRVPCQLVDFGIVSGDIKEGNRAGEKWYMLEWKVEITDPEYLAKWKAKGIDAEKCTLRDSFFLDITEGGDIAMGPGKNVDLGKLRKATGTNEPGRVINDMKGKMLRVDVIHRPGKNGDPFAQPANPIPY